MNLTQNNNDFEKLINSVYHTHCLLQENAVKAVNFNLTARNWLVGHYIVEYEQNGKDRAQYGANLLNEMAKQIREKGIKGLDSRTLRACRTFYNLYPQIRQAVFGEFEKLAFEHNVLLTNSKNPIWGSVTPKFQQSDCQEIAIRQSLTAELEKDNYPLSSYQLLSRLSFTHFIELIRVEDNLQRLFYEVEAIKNNWSVRELARAIDTSLALRTTLSTNKEAIIKKIKNLKPTSTSEIMRNPVVLEFLNLEEKSEYSETDLETAILNHLQKFLIELGTGFCFEARQKRITFDNEHYRIDLVFYHRVLKSHILIDLKIGKFDHADAGQMNVYLNYYKENEMSEGDNPPIGLILCGNKKEALARYATTGIDNQMFVSQYLLKLPDRKLLESFIKNEIKNNEEIPATP
ncbi:MAG: PDDEXK nuclease domain-containing protein [Lentimicrobiaceae bacterium]|nr:PDDEXK nuclease domain-containing protein [Lentimicrobiaceae bacterium]